MDWKRAKVFLRPSRWKFALPIVAMLSLGIVDLSTSTTMYNATELNAWTSFAIGVSVRMAIYVLSSALPLGLMNLYISYKLPLYQLINGGIGGWVMGLSMVFANYFLVSSFLDWLIVKRRMKRLGYTLLISWILVGLVLSILSEVQSVIK